MTKKEIKERIRECRMRINELTTEGAFRDTDDQIRHFEGVIEELEAELERINDEIDER